MTKSISLKKTVGLVLVLAVIAVATIGIAGNTTALEGSSTDGSQFSAERRAEIEKKKAERLEELQAKKAEQEAKRQENKEKFTEKRLEQCEKREARINEKMQKIADRKSAQIEVFNKIAERTMAFYVDNNLSLAKYDELVADVATKKGLVEAEIANLESTTVDFQCESEDPLKVSEAFKTAKASLISAMKDYKTSVKNLIVGVKSVAPSDDSQEGGEQ